MRAIATHRFGGNDVLELTDVPDPIVGPDTVLIRTKAVGLNPVDWKSVRGGLKERFPNHFPLVPGWDVAGVVERVGPAVTEFAAGDEVMAYDLGDVGLRLVSVTNPDRVKALGGRYVFVRPNADQLAELGRLAADGSLTVHVRETFPFERAAVGLARVEEGHGPGKVVVLFDE